MTARLDPNVDEAADSKSDKPSLSRKKDKNTKKATDTPIGKVATPTS